MTRILVSLAVALVAGLIVGLAIVHFNSPYERCLRDSKKQIGDGDIAHAICAPLSH